MMKKGLRYIACLPLLLVGCMIENDIPFPTIEGEILAMEVEGQCAATGSSNSAAVIDKTNRTVTLNVSDEVRLSKLKIKKLEISENAILEVDSAVCINYSKFPKTGFSSLSELPISANTAMDFTNPVNIRLKTYQDYDWTVTVNQVLEREVLLDNQIGNAVIDETTRNVVIYVSKDQPLNRIKVRKFNLGGAHGTVTPDPTDFTYFDFSNACTFFVSRAFEEISYKWTVYVYQKESSAATASAFAMTTQATLTGTVQSGKSITVEYKKQGDASWQTLSSSHVKVNGTSFTATLTGLKAETTYSYRVLTNGEAGAEKTLTTAPATPLTDGSFDNWHAVDKLWNPWASGGTSFWDTGNRGATVVGNSNSYPTEETCNGSGKAALLESKYIVIKFAAGNIFTGSYVKTDGTNGVLDFGRPFKGFPTKLRVHYKYQTATINRCGDDDYAYLKGRPDSCHIYIALADWSGPYPIRTRPSERSLFNKDDPSIIAYAELIKGENVNSWKEEDLVLNYRYTNRTPNYIQVTASSSKYGDFFTGGEGAKLWIDNFELIYD